MKNLISYYKINISDFNYLLRDFEQFNYPKRVVFLCKILIIILNYLIEYEEKNGYEISTF